MPRTAVATLLALTIPITGGDPHLGFSQMALASDSGSDSSGSGSDSDDDNDSDDSDDDSNGPPFAPGPAPFTMVTPDELVVGDLTKEDLDRIVADGFVVVASVALLSPRGVLAKLIPPAGIGLEAARERIGLLAPAAIVDLNHVYRPMEMPCQDGNCPPFEMIGWAVPPAQCGIAITLGMIDTAVNTSHEALRNQSITVVAVRSPLLAPSAAVHGTAIAALLVGDGDTRTPGLLPRSDLVAVDAFHFDGTDDAADAYALVVGLDQLERHGVRVANLGFAGPHNAVLERAVSRAAESMILVAAAGNGGPSGPPAYPAAYPETIAVTAVDITHNPYRHAGRGDHIDFAAPGVDLWTAASVSGGRFRSGTSYAVPFVTAAVAAALVALPDAISGVDMTAILAARAIDLGEPGHDNTFGWGLVTSPWC